MGFKGRDTKIEKSRAKIAHEQHGPMLRKKKEGNVNFLSFHLRVKRKGDEIENWGRQSEEDGGKWNGKEKENEGNRPDDSIGLLGLQ